MIDRGLRCFLFVLQEPPNIYCSGGKDVLMNTSETNYYHDFIKLFDFSYFTFLFTSNYLPVSIFIAFYDVKKLKLTGARGIEHWNPKKKNRKKKSLLSHPLMYFINNVIVKRSIDRSCTFDKNKYDGTYRCSAATWTSNSRRLSPVRLENNGREKIQRKTVRQILFSKLHSFAPIRVSLQGGLSFRPLKLSVMSDIKRNNLRNPVRSLGRTILQPLFLYCLLIPAEDKPRPIPASRSNLAPPHLRAMVFIRPPLYAR